MLRWAGVRWAGTVHNGLPLDRYPFRGTPGTYLAFLGRISPEKRVDRAIEIARQSGMPLKVAAKIDPVDRDYFEAEVACLLDDPLVEYVGEIGDGGKQAFLGDAAALLFPIDWPEPFGLVMIEAMASGTPVIAWPHGSVPEVIVDGVSGAVVDSVREAVAAVRRIDRLSRRYIRRAFEEYFTAERMALDHVALYRSLQGRQPGAVPARSTAAA